MRGAVPLPKLGFFSSGLVHIAAFVHINQTTLDPRLSHALLFSFAPLFDRRSAGRLQLLGSE